MQEFGSNRKKKMIDRATTPILQINCLQAKSND
jgi:hypothetical protein